MGSICEKSFSARIRSINTEPTMPRHPINPTLIVFSLISLYVGEERRFTLQGKDVVYSRHVRDEKVKKVEEHTENGTRGYSS